MNDRTVRAVSAAHTLARRFGITCEPIVLAESNHVVVRIGDWVAKAEVESSARTRASLAREVHVALWLARRGAPVVEPVRDAGPHVVDGVTLTLWHYYPSQIVPEASPELLGRALREMHAALHGYAEPVPSFTDHLDDAARLLASPAPLALSDDERTFTLDLFDRLRPGLETLCDARVIHGEFHDGQLLITENGVRWLDFECICRGPIEWDVTGLGDPEHYGAVDEALLARLRIVRSVCTVAWCAVAPHRSSVLRDALDYHLGVLRA